MPRSETSPSMGYTSVVGSAVKALNISMLGKLFQLPVHPQVMVNHGCFAPHRTSEKYHCRQ